MIDQPLELTAPSTVLRTGFLDRLHLEGKRIVPGSLIWLPHPTKPGWMAAAVKLFAKGTNNG